MVSSSSDVVMNADEFRGEEDADSPFVQKCHDRLTNNAKLVLAFWTVAFLVGGYFSTYFINKAQDRLEAPFHSRAAIEEREFNRLFPELSAEAVLILYAESSANAIVCPQSTCKRHCAGEDARLHNLYKYVSERVMEQFPQVGYLSYYNVSGTSLDAIKCQFASGDGKATFGIFRYNPNVMDKIAIHKLIDAAGDALSDYKKEADADLDDFKLGYTGIDVLAKASSESSEKQMVTVDSFTMPVAFFIFYYMVRSWRLLLLCMWNMLITVASSFGFISLLVKAFGLRPMSVQATFAQALAVSMSIDYSLFLHRRFRDEMKNGRTIESSSRVMFQQAGHVVALSCGTFILVFVGFLFLPSHDLIALGEVAVVTLFFALCVNTTNTVAAISTFPEFFSKFTFAPKAPSGGMDAENGSMMTAPLLPPTSTGKKRFRRGAPYKGLYFQFMKKVTVFPNNLIFILFIYALAVPLALQTTRLKHNQNAVQVTPKSAPASKIYEDLQDHFPPGLLGPFSLIVVSETSSAKSRDFFESTHKAIAAISKESNVGLDSFTSPTFLNGKKISYLESVELRDPNSAFCRASNADLCKLYQFVWNQAISKDENALVTSIQVPFNPYSRQGMSFVEDVRKAADAIMAANSNKYRILLTGTEVDFYEDMEVAFSSVTVLIISTLFVVFILLGMGFRAAFIPIRLSLTVFIPLAAVFGFAVLVYQDGILNGLGIEALAPTDDGFFWFIPLVCLFQSLGLVLDYDIFLVHRVLEHRESGYDIQSSVMKATWEVQSTIVSAGLIMASVFGGLLLSDETAIDQFGFLLCLSVLVDTFVVQCFLIGPILSLGDGFSWWPRAMPSENLITLDDEEFAN